MGSLINFPSLTLDSCNLEQGCILLHSMCCRDSYELQALSYAYHRLTTKAMPDLR
jgi:hypothetical protein